MYIKESPVKGVKREFAGFELDASKVELHSARKRNIYLPYSGPLPDALQDSDGAYIFINMVVGLGVGICLAVKKGKKERRYPIEATTQEIKDILFPLFFQKKKNNEFHTRWDAGLTHYWLGNYQSSYINWERLVHDKHGIYRLIGQLQPETLDGVVRYINECKKTA